MDDVLLAIALIQKNLSQVSDGKARAIAWVQRRTGIEQETAQGAIALLGDQDLCRLSKAILEVKEIP